MIKTKVTRANKTGPNSYSITISLEDPDRKEEYSYSFKENDMSDMRSQSHKLFYEAKAYNQFRGI